MLEQAISEIIRLVDSILSKSIFRSSRPENSSAEKVSFKFSQN